MKKSSNFYLQYINESNCHPALAASLIMGIDPTVSTSMSVIHHGALIVHHKGISDLSLVLRGNSLYPADNIFFYVNRALKNNGIKVCNILIKEIKKYRSNLTSKDYEKFNQLYQYLSKRLRTKTKSIANEAEAKTIITILPSSAEKKVRYVSEAKNIILHEKSPQLKNDVAKLVFEKLKKDDPNFITMPNGLFHKLSHIARAFDSKGNASQ